MNKIPLIKKIVSFFFKASLIAISLYAVGQFCQKQTKGFTIARISSDLPYNANWDTTPLSKEDQQETHKILQQKFRYLGAGGQCYAFVSEDDRYVIKFFKHYRRIISWYASLSLPSFLEQKIQKRMQKKQSKLQRDFNSYKLAFEELKEETGLLFVHLNKTDTLHEQVTLVDLLGIEHKIDLDGKEFILQKKADLVYPRIQSLMEKGEKEQVLQLIDSILQSIVSRSKKGIYDEDARIHRNFGIIGDKAIFIDVGRFRKDARRKELDVYTRDIHAIIDPFKAWLSEKYPELTIAIDEKIHEIQMSP